jgi:hypothetical protein
MYARAGRLTILPSSSDCSGELIPGVEDVEVRGQGGGAVNGYTPVSCSPHMHFLEHTSL